MQLTCRFTGPLLVADLRMFIFAQTAVNIDIESFQHVSQPFKTIIMRESVSNEVSWRSAYRFRSRIGWKRRLTISMDRIGWKRRLTNPMENEPSLKLNSAIRTSLEPQTLHQSTLVNKKYFNERRYHLEIFLWTPVPLEKSTINSRSDTFCLFLCITIM